MLEENMTANLNGEQPVIELPSDSSLIKIKYSQIQNDK